MPQYVTPGLYYETVDTARNDVNPARVDIPAFIGIANQGPLNLPTQINSQAQFQAIFGGFMPNSYLAYTVKGFFENGGTRCYVVRVASGKVKAASVELCDGNGRSTLCITASSPGSWGNDLALLVSPSATHSTQIKSLVDRSRAIVESIVGFTPGTLVKFFPQQELKPVAYSIVSESFPEQGMLLWETPLDEGYVPTLLEKVEFSLTVYLAGQIREIFPRLSLVPAFGGDKKNPNPYYVENAINEVTSQLIRVQDLQKGSQSPTSIAEQLPGMKRTDPNKELEQVKVYAKLQGGMDGLIDLKVDDFTGDPGSEEKSGLRTLEDVRDVATVAMPDLTLKPVPVPKPYIPPPPPPPANMCLPDTASLPGPGKSLQVPVEQPPVFSLDDVFRGQQAMVDHCELQKSCIALLDPPVQSPGEVLNVQQIQAWRQRFDSKYAALYYPQLLVYDPLKLGGQLVRAIPPCGHVAGIFARVDSETGVHRAPANEELNWVQAESLDITSAVQGILNPLGINCIRTFPGRGIRIYGARTVSSETQWIYVNVRRLFIMLKRSIEVATQWAVFEPNNFALRQTLVTTISVFLETQWLKGAFVGAKRADAFFVKCDGLNNPKELSDQGQLIVEVGVAPTIPAEFVIFRIGRTLDELEITELQGVT